MFQRCSAFAVLVCALGFPGCGSKLNLAEVTGTVTYQGKPLANATVTFIPTGEGSLGVAVTSEDGSYRIQTGGEDGVAPGPCSVTVSKAESSGNGQAELEKMSESDRQKMMMSGKMPKSIGGPAKSAIPAQYGNAMTSGLSFDVRSGANSFSIELN
ncbi:MAG: carboxypeptidase-like regulatory domain-containing protein [Planctomycetota bacterium]